MLSHPPAAYLGRCLRPPFQPSFTAAEPYKTLAAGGSHGPEEEVRDRRP